MNVAFSANAVTARGGQGEFLRQMALALDTLPGRSRVFSRHAEASRAECWDVPFAGWRRRAWKTLGALPVARGRRDLLTALDDVQFDEGVAASIGEVDLLDGVMAQGRSTFERLHGRSALVLTSLNTHADHLVSVLEEERRRTGAPHAFGPRFLARARREVELATHIRVNSTLAKETFVACGVAASRVTVIQPWVDRAHFHPVPVRDGTFRVLAVSTIDGRKGVHYLLEAFARARLGDAELVIVGATGDRWARRMLDGFRPRIPGLRLVTLDVLRSPVEESYGSCSVLVHPAVEDGYALVVPQALASGRPVIATRQTGASELVANGENGFVVEARDVDALVDRLRLLASDRRLLETMSAAAPRAVAHLDAKGFASAIAALYGKVLGGPSAR